MTSIGLDHLDWLPKNEQTIEKIIFEKTSTLLNSNIIVAKQNTKEILETIKKQLNKNKSKKFFLMKIIAFPYNRIIFFIMKINWVD